MTGVFRGAKISLSGGLRALLPFALLFAAAPAAGRVAEPPHTIHGAVTDNLLPRTFGAVTLVLDGDVDPLVSFDLGALPGAKSRYLLPVPMDAVDPRAPGTARPGDGATLFVDGVLAAAVVIGGRGAFQEVDLTLNSPHGISVTAPPAGLPNPVGSAGAVHLSVTASDTLGHALSYLWSADCPSLGGGGVFSDASLRTPLWTAPENYTGAEADCAIRVLLDDGQGTTLQPAFTQRVAPSAVPLPVPVIGAAPDPAACNEEVVFDGSASFHANPARSIVSWEWDLDYDGAVFTVDATGPAASRTYTGLSGTVTAALRVTGDGAPPLSATGTRVISSGEVNRDPVPDPGGPYTLSSGDPLPLDGSGSADPDAPCGDAVALLEWDLDADGLFDDAAGATPSIPWAAFEAAACAGACAHNGVYPVALRVADSRGGTATGPTYVTVHLDSPVAVLSAVPNPALCGETVDFDGTASSHPRPERSVVAWEWDFDYDGATFDVDATGSTAAHAYPAIGDYTAALRVTDDGTPARQDVATTAVSVTIANTAPTADPGGPYFTVAGGDLVLDGSGSSDPDAGCGDDVILWEWDLDADSFFDDAAGATAVLPWGQVESLVCGGHCDMETSYPLALRVTDRLGGTGDGGTTFAMTYVLFTDDFSDGSKVEDPDWEEIAGAWTVRGAANPFYRSSHKKNNIAAAKDISLAQFSAGILETRLKLTPKARAYPNVSLIFAYQDPLHYRYVRFRGGGRRRLYIGQVGDFGGETAGVKKWRKLNGIRLKKWYPAWVDVYSDGRVLVYFKNRDAEKLSYQFPAAVAGRAGYRAKKARSCLDDFTAWQEGALP